MGHRMANYAKYLGLLVDFIPPIELLDLFDRRLAGGGSRPFSKRDEGEQCAEFSGQHSARESVLAHAQRDCGFVSLLNNFEDL